MTSITSIIIYGSLLIYGTAILAALFKIKDINKKMVVKRVATINGKPIRKQSDDDAMFNEQVKCYKYGDILTKKPKTYIPSKDLDLEMRGDKVEFFD